MSVCKRGTARQSCASCQPGKRNLCLVFLLKTNRLDKAKVRQLLWKTPMEEKWIVRTHQVLEEIVRQASASA
jgi:hypothetical protein